jgi:sulfate adenylyltransferase subunit 2
MTLTHLQQLEAEHRYHAQAISSERPVMLYSIGKDKLGRMLHLAVKAFFPSKPPFPSPCRHHLEIPRNDRSFAGP